MLTTEQHQNAVAFVRHKTIVVAHSGYYAISESDAMPRHWLGVPVYENGSEWTPLRPMASRLLKVRDCVVVTRESAKSVRKFAPSRVEQEARR